MELVRETLAMHGCLVAKLVFAKISMKQCFQTVNAWKDFCDACSLDYRIGIRKAMHKKKCYKKVGLRRHCIDWQRPQPKGLNSFIFESNTLKPFAEMALVTLLLGECQTILSRQKKWNLLVLGHGCAWYKFVNILCQLQHWHCLYPACSLKAWSCYWQIESRNGMGKTFWRVVITQTVVTRKIRFSGQNPDFWATRYVLSEEEKPPFSQMNFSLTLRGELIWEKNGFLAWFSMFDTKQKRPFLLFNLEPPPLTMWAIFCDLYDPTKFRWSWTKIRHTFPSDVGIAKYGQHLA